MSCFKIYPELIPQGNWGYNLRSYLKPEQWRRISRYIRTRANNICEICGDKSYELEAHELWIFDDYNHVQTLESVKAVCPLCHRAFHIGQTISQNDPVLLDNVYKHIKRVNECSDYELRNLITTVQNKWKIRSEYAWLVAVDDRLLDDLLEKSKDY